MYGHEVLCCGIGLKVAEMLFQSFIVHFPPISTELSRIQRLMAVLLSFEKSPTPSCGRNIWRIISIFTVNREKAEIGKGYSSAR